MNASERRLGLASALTLKSQEGHVRVIEKLDAKTSVMAKALHDITKTHTALVFITAEESKKAHVLQNLHGVHVYVVTHASPSEILKYDFCVFTKGAMKELSLHFVEDISSTDKTN